MIGPKKEHAHKGTVIPDVVNSSRLVRRKGRDVVLSTYSRATNILRRGHRRQSTPKMNGGLDTSTPEMTSKQETRVRERLLWSYLPRARGGTLRAAGGPLRAAGGPLRAAGASC